MLRSRMQLRRLDRGPASERLKPHQRPAISKIRGAMLSLVTSAAERPKMTAAEYLAWERAQPTRHEFVHGRVLAMAGGSPRHNFIAANALAALHEAFRGGECKVFTSDQKLAAAADEHFVYADVTVVCGKPKLSEGTTDVIENPRIVVEVLSQGTEKYDRGTKWESYRDLPSLSDYLLVSQAAARVEHFAREPDGSWRYRVLSAGDRVKLAAGANISVDTIYDGAFELEGE